MKTKFLCRTPRLQQCGVHLPWDTYSNFIIGWRESDLGAEQHNNHIEMTLKNFYRSTDCVVLIIGESCNINWKLSSLLEKSFIGCESNKHGTVAKTWIAKNRQKIWQKWKSPKRFESALGALSIGICLSPYRHCSKGNTLVLKDWNAKETF